MQYETKTHLHKHKRIYAQWNGPSVTKPNQENCKNCSPTGLTSFCRACRKSAIITCNFSVASGSISTFDVAYRQLCIHVTLHFWQYLQSVILQRHAVSRTQQNSITDMSQFTMYHHWLHDLPRVGLGHPPLSPLSPCSFTSSSFVFLLFPFFHWLHLFSSFVHPLPFYQNSPTPFRGRRL